MTRYIFALAMSLTVVFFSCVDDSSNSDVKTFNYDAWQEQADIDTANLAKNKDCALSGEVACIDAMLSLVSGAYYQSAEGGEYISELLIEIFMQHPEAFMLRLSAQTEDIKEKVSDILITPADDKYGTEQFKNALAKCGPPTQYTSLKKIFEAYGYSIQASPESGDDNLSFDEIDKLIDQYLEKRKNKYDPETMQESKRILNALSLKLEDDRIKTSVGLLRMHQYSDATSLEFIGWKLNETFFRYPRSVVSALNEIKIHLLEENRNQEFINLLIVSSCQIPQFVTESNDLNEDRLTDDANRIITEVRSMDVEQDLKVRVIRIVTGWTRNAQ